MSEEHDIDATWAVSDHNSGLSSATQTDNQDLADDDSNQLKIPQNQLKHSLNQ